MSITSNFPQRRRRIEQEFVQRATEAIRSVALEAYSTVQRESKGNTGSAVASGRLAASMRIGINRIDNSVAPPDPDYQYPRPEVHQYNKAKLPGRTVRNQAISRQAAKLRGFRLGDTIFISNSVPYIRRIEIGRHSWQTPDGIFGPSMRDVERRFRNIRIDIRIG